MLGGSGAGDAAASDGARSPSAGRSRDERGRPVAGSGVLSEGGDDAGVELRAGHTADLRDCLLGCPGGLVGPTAA